MSVPRPRARDLRQPVLLLALGFGAGLVPRAPGTAGTLVGVAIYAALVPLPAWVYAGVLLAAVIGGVPLCAVAARRLGQHDHPAIVWDEIAGFLVAAVALPAHPAWIGAAFVAFRAFDIAKPFPISLLDRRLPGGLGIMLDDVLAGLAACGLVHAVRLGLQASGLV